MKNNELGKKLIGIGSIFTYFFFLLYTSSLLENLSEKKSTIIKLVISFLILIILILINRKRLSENFKDYKKNFISLIKRNFKYWACAVLIMFAANLVIGLMFNRLSSANDQGIRDMFNISPLYVILSAVIIAPITEELVFRESIKNLIKNKYAFIIVSGLLFGFMHILASLKTVSDILYIIPYSAPGIFFAYMLYKEDNVLVPITFHSIHNIMSLILLVVAKLLGVM